MIKAFGILGRHQHSLSPSTRALGPNTYASDRTFFSMLLLAFIVHAVGLIIANLMPPKPVTDIPVHAMSFKIGDVVPPAPVAEPQPSEPPPPAPEPLATEIWQAPPKLLPPPKLIPPADVPVRHVREALPAPAATPAVQMPPAEPAAASETAQRFVRATGAAPVTASDIFGDAPPNLPMAPEAPAAPHQDIRGLYAKQIASWIERHKATPAAAQGISARVVVRMRIDRAGYVRYYALEETSGNEVLDKAAIDMVRRANPVPAAPAGYPASSLIEFLVPIVFKAN